MAGFLDSVNDTHTCDPIAFINERGRVVLDTFTKLLMQIRQFQGTLLMLVGEGIGELGLISSRVMLCAAHQAHVVLQILAGVQDV